MTDSADEPPARDPALWGLADSERSDPSAPVGGARSTPAPGEVGSEIRRSSGGPLAAAGTVSIARAADSEQVAPRTERAHLRTSPRRGRGRTREQALAWVVCLAAAVAGAFVDVTPTGNRVADRLFAAGFAALLAAAGSSAKRWTWFVAAGAALGLADGWVAIGAGGIALLIAFVATHPVRPAPAVGAAVGGLSAVALMLGYEFWFHGASALAVAVAVAPMLLSGYRYAGRVTQRRVGRTVVVLAVVATAVVGLYGALLAQSRSEIEQGMQRLEQGMAVARDGDDVQAQQLFGEAAEAFGSVDDALGGWWAEPAEVLPLIGHNARAVQAMASTAADLSRQGEEAAADADVDQLTISGGQLDLERVRSLEQPLVDVSATLERGAARMTSVETAWLAAPVADRVDRVQGEIADARPDARVAADAVRVVPAIFGGERESRWLVVFTTPVEARGRVGFVGNFAELTAVDGNVDMPRFGRVGELEQGGTPVAERTLSGPDDYLARWSRYLPSAGWRNITMSPDFPSIGQVMTELYPQSGGRPVDGVIAVDPTALAALLQFTGPVTVPGVPEPFTADNAAEFLLLDQYVELPDTGERVDVLENLARTTFERLTSGDLPSPRTVADVLGPSVRDGHIQLYGTDRAQQELFTEIDADGALPPVDGDFLAVVNSNATGNKIDRFLSRGIDYRPTWNPETGEVSATLAVTLVNTAPSSGLPDYVLANSLGEDGADLPLGTNRTHLSIYSPFALEGADLDGQPVDLPAEVERDRYAYSLFLDVPPDGGARVLTLNLRGYIPVDGRGYRLDVAGQPVVTPDRLSLTVESTAGEPLTAGAPMEVAGASASAAVSPTQHETTFRVNVDEGG
jgi:hypothetical protein